MEDFPSALLIVRLSAGFFNHSTLSSRAEREVSQSEPTSHNLRSARFQKPMNKALQTVLEFRLRIVTEKFPRFENVGAGQRHVARLLRQPVDLCFFAERVLDR